MLLRFAVQTYKALDHIAEAVIAIVFAWWNSHSQTLITLRPDSLPMSPFAGMSYANLLGYEVSNYVATEGR